jgi:hypothetical protein
MKIKERDRKNYNEKDENREGEGVNSYPILI